MRRVTATTIAIGTCWLSAASALPTEALAGAGVRNSRAACERIKAAVANQDGFDAREIAFCDVVGRQDSPRGYYVLALHGFRPDCGGICSTNAGWYAIETASGRVYEWDVAESALGKAVETSAPDAARSSSPEPSLGALQVRLWYEATGNLSENIAPPASFAAWNIIIAEGDAREVANDALFTVDVISNRGAAHIDTPLKLTVRNARGRVLASKTIATTLTSTTGRAVKGLWLSEVGCAGSLTFEARLGASRKQATIDLRCGE
ncbi:MAG: hypothetical protein A2790_05010 [Phenylobacterium sp. RIFCSPHIGHO2_01_FULL_69_31]|nr:MAG: hypothetical protein A2790_05010 [Phenylobacterium sp. RIFCSPHIGHO2_01_FULL_69_31]